MIKRMHKQCVPGVLSPPPSPHLGAKLLHLLALVPAHGTMGRVCEHVLRLLRPFCRQAGALIINPV